MPVPFMRLSSLVRLLLSAVSLISEYVEAVFCETHLFAGLHACNMCFTLLAAH